MPTAALLGCAGYAGQETLDRLLTHPDLEPVARHFGVPYYHLPKTREADQLALLEEQQIDLVVLARYMQILSPEFVAKWEHRIINIHHSFLPAFVGASPHRQAYERGVKLIGATAHYATTELDEGPIIEQDVERVDHSRHVDDLVALGQDVERRALARAVRWHAEHRVLLDGHRTIVFR